MVWATLRARAAPLKRFQRPLTHRQAAVCPLHSTLLLGAMVCIVACTCQRCGVPHHFARPLRRAFRGPSSTGKLPVLAAQSCLETQPWLHNCSTPAWGASACCFILRLGPRALAAPSLAICVCCALDLLCCRVVDACGLPAAASGALASTAGPAALSAGAQPGTRAAQQLPVSDLYALQAAPAPAQPAAAAAPLRRLTGVSNSCCCCCAA